ncbi:hypothetical protein CDV36_016344 [Fusarium kuroshium]|uniref:Uncharacterized protein n=1 Tax=Fusarium kuroshium TaxID=2010991 RepID=A0A3M2QTD9_9HYPO|nr:hypothetical protein CDV36_016344 [Fusarium kuroshium]
MPIHHGKLGLLQDAPLAISIAMPTLPRLGFHSGSQYIQLGAFRMLVCPETGLTVSSTPVGVPLTAPTVDGVGTAVEPGEVKKWPQGRHRSRCNANPFF